MMQFVNVHIQFWKYRYVWNLEVLDWRRLRAGVLCESEHLALLSFNTSYITRIEYRHIYKCIMDEIEA